MHGSIHDEGAEVLVGWPGLATVRALDFGGFWPSDQAFARLLDALSKRAAPLESFVSTGGVPPQHLLDRLRGLAARVDVRP
jgi:hypothetical protein